MYVFKPRLVSLTLYLKVMLRGDCVVVSFHGDLDGFEQEDGNDEGNSD